MGTQLLVTEFSKVSFLTQSYSSHVNPALGDSKATLKKTIMICEDDPDLLRVFRLSLRSKFDVITTKSGKECLETYSEAKQNGKKIEVLLLDFRLPDATGDKIAVKLKGLNGTKVILISAYEIDSQIIDELKESGSIVMFVKKPISLESLWHVVDVTLSM